MPSCSWSRVSRATRGGTCGPEPSPLLCPVAHCGFRARQHHYVIGLDKPATGIAVLEQAHNDWLEWLSTAGAAGAAVMTLLLFSLLARLRPRRVRHLRFELRYPLAGAAAALVANSLHEIVGFGVQTPLNRYLVAVWVGLVWGVWNRVEEGRARATVIAEGEEHHGGGSSKVEQMDDGADLMVTRMTRETPPPLDLGKHLLRMRVTAGVSCDGSIGGACGVDSARTGRRQPCLRQP